MHVIPLALDTRDLNILPKKNNYPAVGYFSRINPRMALTSLWMPLLALKRITGCQVSLFMFQADLQGVTSHL